MNMYSNTGHMNISMERCAMLDWRARSGNYRDETLMPACIGNPSYQYLSGACRAIH